MAASVEEGVRTGAIPPGAPLPPVRALAADLELSAATVAAAYKLLRTRGPPPPPPAPAAAAPG